MRVPVLGLAAGLVVLDRDASRYVRDVRRLALGDRFVAFDPDARVEADAEIVGLELRGAVTARLDPPRPAPLLPSRPVTLVQCVGKSDKLDAVVRDATELGATEILTARSERTVASRDSDAALARYRRIALEAARQCGRGDLPRIAAPQALVDVLRTIAAPIRLLLHPAAQLDLRDRVDALPRSTAAAIVIGPEGGFSERERAWAEGAGFVPVRLGCTILRTETAATAALGALLVLGQPVRTTPM